MIKRLARTVAVGVVSCLLMQVPVAVLAQDGKATVVAHIESKADHYSEIAQTLWDLAELGYMEHQSAALLESSLEDAGFDVEIGVAEMPTAFLASYGTGSPVVGILAEYDALPGMSQARVPVKQLAPEMESGHGCGHHLFGAGSVAAAIAVKDWLESTGAGGTVRLYGTPAEEGGAGKVFMARAGLFDDVDAGAYAVLPNEALSRAMHANMEQVGGVQYDDADRSFAEAIRPTLPEDAPPIETAAEVGPFFVFHGAFPASTDVGDVSWVAPTAVIRAATWVPGTASHTWQAVAAGGTSIGNKGMVVAAKTIAMTAIDVLTDSELVAAAREEYERRVGSDFEYVPLQGDRAPPLDYRGKP